MATARRIYVYVLALAGLLAVLIAASGLLALIVTTLTQRASVLVGANATRDQASLYLAALIVGLPIWLIHWLAARRAARRSGEERDAVPRRLFFAAVFAITSIVALFALHGLLRFLFGLPALPAAEVSWSAAIGAAARLLVYGAAWLGFTLADERGAFAGRANDEADEARDLAVYLVSGVTLVAFLVGLGEALRQVIAELVSLLGGRVVLLAGPAPAPWLVWANAAAWLLAGGALWAAVWRSDLRRAAVLRWRVAYLYLVLIAAAPTTLAAGGYVLGELLRLLFGYRPSVDGWDFLRNWLPVALVAGVTWAYHWTVVRRQARYVGTAAAAAPAIAWPRRPALAGLVFVGLAAAIPALIALLWLVLDFAFPAGVALSGPDWWRDRLSFSIAAGLVGTATWIGAWSVLQRAAGASAAERGALARRLLLGAIVLLAALSAIAFTIALLWLGLRALLGESLTPASVSLAFKEFSGALVATGLAVYHSRLLRDDLAFVAKATPRPLRLLVVVAPEAEETLAALRRQPGLQVEVIGQLAGAPAAAGLDRPALEERLAALAAQGSGERALLVVDREGASLYPLRG